MAGPWEKYQQEDGPWTKYGPAPAEQPSTISDIARSGMTGLRQGVEGVVSMMGDANQASGNFAAWLAGIAGAGEEAQDTIRSVGRRMSLMPFAPTSEEVTGATTALVGEHYEPQTMAGEYARTVGQFAPAAATGPGGIGRRAVMQVLLPALTSETAGQLTKDTAMEPYARIAGALGGAMLPEVGRRIASPLPISASRQKMVDVLSKEGVDLTAGQKSGRNALRYAESELGGAKYADFIERQGEQFTSAALKRIGVNANRATPEVLDDAARTIGQQFDDLAARNQIVPDRKMVDDFVDVWRDYSAVTNESARAPIIKNTIEEIVNAARKSGRLSGDFYQSTISRLGRASRTNDPELKQAIMGMRSVLDDAMERSMQAAGSPDIGAWQEARRQYKNMLVIERAATGSGENAAMGLISPSQLRGATAAQNRRAYARGQGDFAELSRAGEAVMKALPQSGTAPRHAVRNMGTGLATILGAGGGSAVGGPTGAILGALMGTAAPATAGRLLLTGPVRSYLGNQAATGGGGGTGLRSLIATLLAAQNNRQAILAPIE